MPASQHMVALFASYLSNSLSWKTIRLYLSSITHQHHLKGFRSTITDNRTVQLVLQGIERQQSRIQTRCCRPITMQVLEKLMEGMRQDHTLGTHDQLMLHACYSPWFLRVGEFTTSTQCPPTELLARRDISLLRDQMKVFLHFSKTDQLGKGNTITHRAHWRCLLPSSSNAVIFGPLQSIRV